MHDKKLKKSIIQVFKSMKLIKRLELLTILDESLALVIGKQLILIHFFKIEKW